jgi:hypothetical protein
MRYISVRRRPRSNDTGAALIVIARRRCRGVVVVVEDGEPRHALMVNRSHLADPRVSLIDWRDRCGGARLGVSRPPGIRVAVIKQIRNAQHFHVLREAGGHQLAMMSKG